MGGAIVEYKAIPVAPMLKGLAAETDIYTQPKGTFPRGANLLLNKRGALDTCDGSQLVHAFNGAIQSGRGKVMEPFLFQPTGASSYYLALMKALDIPLGAPQNLTASAGSGGTLAAGTYFYVVTALDGANGETNISNEVSATVGASGKVTLTWNFVPNAQGYNVYRGTASGGETILSGAGLPVPQVPFGNLTVSYVDSGAASSATTPIVPAASNGVEKTSLVVGGLIVVNFFTLSPHNLTAGNTISAAGVTNANFNAPYTVLAVTSNITFRATTNAPSVVALPIGTISGGGVVISSGPPPIVDTTQQCALFQMPLIVGSPAPLPVAYNNSNIVALYPADLRPIIPDGGGGGGSGGGGGTGGGGATGGTTVSGGVAGTLSFIPQMVQFTNRVAMALGNGFPPQLFSDATGTPTNPATVEEISSVTVDAFGVVTVTVPDGHGLLTSPTQVGANVLLSGITNALYNGAFPTISIVSSTVFKVRNLAAIGQAASSGGTSTTTSVPIVSTFVPGFPTWTTAVAYSTNSIVTPTVANNHFYKAIQGGVSGGSQPTFPTTTGAQVSDGSIIWQEAGLTNTAAPPPPGCGHVTVYAGSLWMLNTSPTNTSTGIDGPCSLRMSDVNNPNSWNPINQAFLDKDDGTEGMGLASFTITAQGIPPEGSLVVFKNYSGYQVVGVFGSVNLTIQRIKSDMGCLAPRTLQFVPGYGITRFSHLGFAVFDGVEDKIISEDIRPFLFPTNDFQEQDIVVLDASAQSLMWGFQTANPPMYCAAMPVGNSGGQLTQIACYDLVLKAWTAMVQLPFAISSAAQFRTVSANPVTILGGFSDGLLSRWEAGDQMWDTGGTGARVPSVVNFSVKLPEAVAQSADTKLNCRRVAIRGISTSAAGPITVTPIVNGVQKPPKSYPIPVQGDWEVFASFMYDGLRFSAVISGSGQLELDRFSFHISEKPVGAAQRVS
jgi:hypothetical protein